MHPSRLTGLTLAGVLLLTGCATSSAGTQTQPAATASPDVDMSPGMTMPDGSVMGAAAKVAAAPSVSAKMICEPEVRGDIGKILQLATPPPVTSTWAQQLFTCTYQLPQGKLVLSVKQSADAVSTRAYFAGERRRLAPTSDLLGLTASAFGTANGRVVLVKDHNTLTVDATALPAVFGAQEQKRADFAYEVASTILGCWTGK